MSQDIQNTEDENPELTSTEETHPEAHKVPPVAQKVSRF